MTTAYEQWLEDLKFGPAQSSEQRGSVIQLVINVNPGGWGNFAYIKPGETRQTSYPFGNEDEATNAFREIWRRAQQDAQHRAAHG